MQAVKLSERERFSGEKFQKVNIFDSPRMFCDIYCFEPGQKQALHAHDGADKIYYVLAGMQFFFGLIPLIYVVMGAFMITFPRDRTGTQSRFLVTKLVRFCAFL